MSVTLLVILIALQVADGWTTWRALSDGKAREANPLLAWLMERIGTVPALLAVKGAGVAISVYLVLSAPVAAGLMALGYAAIVANNLRVMRR